MGSYSEDEKDQLLALMDDGRIAIFTAWGFLIPTVSWAEVNDYHIRYLKTLNGFKEIKLNAINKIIVFDGGLLI